jgi:hypothetical protein
MSSYRLIMLQIRRELASLLRRANLTCQPTYQSEDGATATSVHSPTRETACVDASRGNGDHQGAEVGLMDDGVVSRLSSLLDGMAVTNLPSVGGQCVVGDLRRVDSLARRAGTMVLGPQGGWNDDWTELLLRLWTERGAEARKPCRPRLVSLASLPERGRAVSCLEGDEPSARRSHWPRASRES